MNTTIDFFKSLQGLFTLPALPVKEGTELNDWEWLRTGIVLNVSLKGMDDDHSYNLQVDIQDFQEHCELTNEIPKDGFCEWFEDLSWFDQQVEAETYANKFLAKIKADRAEWMGNRKAI